jgi:hypothetical protein
MENGFVAPGVHKAVTGLNPGGGFFAVSRRLIA